MPTVVDIPGLGRVEFPDGMSREDMLFAVKNHVAAKEKGIAQNAAATAASPVRTEGGAPNPLTAAYRGVGSALAAPYRAAGKLDVAQGIKTPEQAESRAQTYGNFTRDMAMGAAMPWSKAAGLPGALARMGQSAGLGAAQGGLESGTIEGAAKGAGVGAASGGVAEGARGLAKGLLNSRAYENVRADLSKKLENALGTMVPAWKGMSLHEMTLGNGQRALDTMFKGAKGGIPEGTMADVPEEVARAAGLLPEGFGKGMPPGMMEVLQRAGKVPEGFGPGGSIRVPTRNLVDKLSELDPALKRQAWDSIDRSLGPLAGKELQSARAAYRWGMGWYEGATKGKLFDEQGKFLPEKAQSMVLSKLYPEVLEPRDMGRLKGLALGATPAPIQAINRSPWIRMAEGAKIGGLLGSPLGLGGAGGGAGLGALAGYTMLPARHFTNMPIQPLERGLSQLAGPLNAAGQQVISTGTESNE